MSTTKSTESAKPCTFFNTPSGCRNGIACAFSHDVSTGKPPSKPDGKPSAKPDGKPDAKPKGKPDGISCKWGDYCTKRGCTNVHPSNLEELRKRYAAVTSQLAAVTSELAAFEDEMDEKLKEYSK
jgi:hypothetical protein